MKAQKRKQGHEEGEQASSPATSMTPAAVVKRKDTICAQGGPTSQHHSEPSLGETSCDRHPQVPPGSSHTAPHCARQQMLRQAKG